MTWRLVQRKASRSEFELDGRSSDDDGNDDKNERNPSDETNVPRREAKLKRKLTNKIQIWLKIKMPIITIAMTQE